MVIIFYFSDIIYFLYVTWSHAKPLFLSWSLRLTNALNLCTGCSVFAFVAKRNGRDRPATDTPSSNVLITTRCRPSRPAAHQNSAGHLHPYQDRRCIGSALGCSTVGPLNSTIIVHNSQCTGWRHSNLIITTLLNCHTLHCAARACTRVSSLSLPPSLPPPLSLCVCVWDCCVDNDMFAWHVQWSHKNHSASSFFFFGLHVR